MKNGKRLIDANALFPYGAVPYVADDGFETADKIYGIIKNAPTVDAVEVVHGRWIYTEDTEFELDDYWICSECNNHTFFQTNYCDNCGAKMDGDYDER